MKRPSKKAIETLRLALGMSQICVNTVAAEMILTIQSEVERLGGEYSLRDAAKVEAFVMKNNKPKQK